MPSITFLEVDHEDLPLVAGEFPAATVHSDVLADKALIEACKDAEIVSCFIYSRFTREVIEHLPKLKLLCTRSVGFNHIDLATCQERGIVVCNVPDYGSHVIAEHVFALLLSKLRHIAEGDAKVERGEFDYHGLRGISLRGKTIGIVGTGKIGRRVAQIAFGFGMKIVAVDKCRTVELVDMLGVRYVEMPQLLAESDIITLHAPATDETQYMINAQTIALMKDNAVLVNTARGELIDSTALLDALQSKKIRYALLDVLEHEQNFEKNKALIDHPNVITTPHVAFYAEESMRNMYDDAFQSIRQFLDDKVPEHVVKTQHVVCDMKGISTKSEIRNPKK